MHMNQPHRARAARAADPARRRVVTSAVEHAAVRGGFLDPGMQLITKPFTFDLLTAKVREMIQA